MFRSFDHHQGAVCSLLKLYYKKKNQAVNVFSNVILARNRQLPDDDRMIETCRCIFKSFNVNKFKCVHWLVYRSSDCVKCTVQR